MLWSKLNDFFFYIFLSFLAERSNTVPDRSIRDVNSTPTTSSFSPVRRRSIHMSSADSPRRLNKEKGVSYDSMATRIGRQLREITSSQSSESGNITICLEILFYFQSSSSDSHYRHYLTPDFLLHILLFHFCSHLLVFFLLHIVMCSSPLLFTIWHYMHY